MQNRVIINKSKPFPISSPKKIKQNFPNLTPEMVEALGIDNDPDVKTISSEFHTLFVEDESMSPGSIVIPIEIISKLTANVEIPFNISDIGDSIQLDAPEFKYKKYTLFISDFMQTEDKKENYYRILKEFSKAKPEDKIVIYVSSDGGSIDEGIQVMKHIRSNFIPENITTILDPKGYSMGSFMFLIGNTRIISEDSTIMLHNYSMGTWGKGGEIKDYVDFADELFTKHAHKRYVETGYITEEEFNQFLIGKEWWFNCKTMCERKMATHVSTDDGESLTAEEYLDKVNKVIKPVAKNKAVKPQTPKVTKKSVVKKKTAQKKKVSSSDKTNKENN